MTLDEELLRAIIGQFTVIGTGCLPFNKIAEKLKNDHPDLVNALYESEAHLWAYIRCYPEQFAVDQDPRHPWNIYYLAKCKIVAKADRNRYRREFTDGNIRIEPDMDKVLNDVEYDLNLEKRAIIHFFAAFDQVGRIRGVPITGLDMTKVGTVYRIR